jgi:hypothetical protein
MTTVIAASGAAAATSVADGGDALKVPFETLNVLKGTFETSAMS